MVFEALIAKVAGLSLLAKTGVAAAAVAAGATGAGLTGMLPDAAQDALDRAGAPEVPVEVPAEIPSDVPDVDLPDIALPAAVTERPTPEPSEVQEVPGEDGLSTADDRAGDNGSEGREIANQAAALGREFGEQRAAEAQERRDAAPPVPTIPENAVDARDLAEGVRESVPTRPEVDAPPVEAPVVDAPPVDVPVVNAPPADVPVVDAPPVEAPTGQPEGVPSGRP